MKKDCRNCKYAGWDPDGNYCVAPKVLEKHAYGRTIHDYEKGIQGFCEAPDYPLHIKSPATKPG